MCQKSWWVGSAVLAFAAFAGGGGLGYFWRAKPEANPNATAAREKPETNPKPPAPPPDGMRLERFKDPEGLLEQLKDTIFVRKLSGNKYVKIWGEVETNGKTRWVMELNSTPLVQFAGPIKHYEGKFTWLRRPTGSPVKQAWRMTLETKNSSSFANNEAWLFDGQTPIKSVRELPAPVHEVPDLLPTDRAVCLHESRLLCEFDDRFQAASDLGLLGSAASTNPLAAAVSLAVPKTGVICAIRLMCTVEPDVSAPGK
jgi:hypothetical protein